MCLFDVNTRSDGRQDPREKAVLDFIQMTIVHVFVQIHYE
jgi:signal recognition particle subunit SEC65